MEHEKVGQAALDQEAWLSSWMRAALGSGAMSQRKLASIKERGGGLEAAIDAARARGLHLCQIIDDQGTPLVVASQHPFKVLI